MEKEVGSRTKRNRIARYMDSILEEFEVLEDNLLNDEPVIKLQTKLRIITLKCDSTGKVIETFRMRRGAGSKEEFLLKQEAMNVLEKYYNDYYTGAKIKLKSFDEGIIKLELDAKITTLIYNHDTKSVEEKDRARRGTKIEIKVDKTSQKGFRKNTDPEIDKLAKKIEKGEYTQTSIEDFIKTEPSIAVAEIKSYDKITEGTIIRNKYNNKDYKVVKLSDTNVVEVFDKDAGYLTMARSDIEIMVAIPGAEVKDI